MDDASFLRILVPKVHELGLDLSAQQQTQCVQYLHILLSWNQKMNLTAIRDKEQILTHHFLDGLALVSKLPTSQKATLIDVGSGAGFPGALCSIIYPHWEITLVERIQKKAVFLLALRRELQLSFQVRMDDIKNIHDTFDRVVSRATFPPKIWVETGANLVAQQGFLFAMLGKNDHGLTPPQGFIKSLEWEYDIGIGTRRLEAFQKLPDSIDLAI